MSALSKKDFDMQRTFLAGFASTLRGLGSHLVRLLIGRHTGEGLSGLTNPVVIALFFAWGATSLLRPAVGAPPAVLIGAVFGPLLLLGFLRGVRVVRSLDGMLAFLLVSSALNTVLLLWTAVLGLPSPWVQGALDVWGYGASVFFAFTQKVEPPAVAPEHTNPAQLQD